jgi:hypothetical protein
MIPAVNMPKYATVLNGGSAILGTGASTVGATLIGVDGIAADAKVCYTAGAYGGIVESLMLSTNDTAAVNALIYAMEGVAVVHVLGIVPVPLSSGNALNVLNVDGLTNLKGLPYNAAGKPYLSLRANMTLKVAVLAAMTANKYLFAKTTGVDFSA